MSLFKIPQISIVFKLLFILPSRHSNEISEASDFESISIFSDLTQGRCWPASITLRSGRLVVEYDRGEEGVRGIPVTRVSNKFRRCRFHTLGELDSAQSARVPERDGSLQALT